MRLLECALDDQSKHARSGASRSDDVFVSRSHQRALQAASESLSAHLHRPSYFSISETRAPSARIAEGLTELAWINPGSGRADRGERFAPP